MNTVAHELFTPLTPIQIQLHILRERSQDRPEEELRALQMVARNFDRLKMLVTDVLDAVRAQAGHLAVRKRPTDLAALVAQTAETFRSVAAAEGVRLVEHTEGSCQAEVDPQRVSQVLYNLVSNAIKFTPRGGSVRLRLLQEGDACVLRVEDTGIGMTAEQLERLFQPFSQVHGPALSRGGTGLGLHISKEIIELHGGTLTATSAGPGRGSCFQLRFPVASAQAPEAQAAAPPAAQDAPSPQRRAADP
jgi:signal transduction histidine kinase